jgi:hypothetical protein
MPTGTSTIFGVFQAILALLVTGRTSPSGDKLLRNEKFASEIFFHSCVSFYGASQNNSHLCGAGRQNKARSISSWWPIEVPGAGTGFAGSDKERVRCRRPPQKEAAIRGFAHAAIFLQRPYRGRIDLGSRG